MGETTIIDRRAVSARITCPTCHMSASADDHRQLRPVMGERGLDRRCCRNCGDRFVVDAR